jgi:guanosine-3',5'-bis(diphosphate) 3'-pyrophosphohydrolase
VLNKPGVLATVAAAIAAAESNIENVEYTERDATAATLLFTIEVKNRKHLADVMRRVRRTGVVSGVYRHPL